MFHLVDSNLTMVFLSSRSNLHYLFFHRDYVVPLWTRVLNKNITIYKLNIFFFFFFFVLFFVFFWHTAQHYWLDHFEQHEPVFRMWNILDHVFPWFLKRYLGTLKTKLYKTQLVNICSFWTRKLDSFSLYMLSNLGMIIVKMIIVKRAFIVYWLPWGNFLKKLWLSVYWFVFLYIWCYCKSIKNWVPE